MRRKLPGDLTGAVLGVCAVASIGVAVVWTLFLCLGVRAPVAGRLALALLLVVAPLAVSVASFLVLASPRRWRAGVVVGSVVVVAVLGVSLFCSAFDSAPRGSLEVQDPAQVARLFGMYLELMIFNYLPSALLAITSATAVRKEAGAECGHGEDDGDGGGRALVP